MANNVGIVGTSPTWTAASNWTSGAAPASGETLYLTNSAQDLTASLDQHTVALASLNQDMSYTGSLGINSTLSAYTYLQIAAPVGNLGLPVPGGGTSQGSRLFNWNAGTTSTTINVMNTASSGSVNGQAPVKLLGSALTVNLTNGIISIAALATETATVAALKIVNGGSGVSPQAYLGPGCTITSLVMNAGSVVSASAALIPTATVARSSTELVHVGSGGIGTLSLQPGAKVTYDGSGSISSFSCWGTIDFSGGGAAVTITNTTLYSGYRIIDPLGRVTFTNQPTLVGCSMKDGVFDLGQGRIV